MLAKLFSLFFFLMPVCLVQAQDSADYTNSFGGVDSYQDSSKIAKTDAQDALNVLTDNGKLTKRPGSVAIATVLNGFPIYTIGEYISPSNVRYLIAQASTTVYASDLGATGFVAIATVTAGYPLDFTPAFGKVYFTNGIDTPFSWDGTTTVWLPTFPKCGHVEFADERIYCSNAPNFRSTTYASRYGDATDWTIPAVSPLPADAPNSFTFNRNDGDQINCMKVTPWGKFIGKKNSAYILKGQDNDHYYKQIVSPTVGCLDDRSVQMVDGDLVWLGQDSTIYNWSGNEAPKPASREIDSYVKSIRQATAQQNNYNTSTPYDWRAGTVTWNGTRPGLDIETWPGSVKPSTWSHINDEAAHWLLGSFSGTSTSPYSGSISLGTSPVVAQLYSNFDYKPYSDSWTFGSGTNYFSNNMVNDYIRYTQPAGGTTATGYVYSNKINTPYGSWKSYLYARAYWSGTPTGNTYIWSSMEYFFISSTNNPSTTSGYSVKADCPKASKCTQSIIKYVGGVPTTLASKTQSGTPSIYFGDNSIEDNLLIVSVSSSGVITASGAGDVSPLSATDPLVSLINSPYLILRAYTGATGAGDGLPTLSAQASAGKIYIPGGYVSSGTWTSPIYDTQFSTPVGGAFYFNATNPVGSTITYRVRQSTASDGGGFDTWQTVSTTTSGAYHIDFNKRYWQEESTLKTSYSTVTPTVDMTYLDATTTGTYYSKPQYIGTSITSWDLFSADQQVSNVALSTYAIRSSLAPFDILSATPAWTTQVNGSVPTISTGSYVQFKFDLNPVTSTNTLQVDGVNIAWREGESRPLASLYDDHRYVLCANTSTSTVINDLCLVWQKNKKWVPFSGQSWGALARFNNYPIAGDGSTGSKIWKVLDPTYLNDDGVAINAYWVSKDFDYDKPNQVKVPMKIWFEADALPTSFLAVGFAADKGSTYTSTTVDLAQSAYLNTNVSSIFDGFALGKYFKFKFSDNTLNSTFKLNAYSVYYDSKPLGQE